MSHRPTVYGTRHAVSAGHYLAAAAGFAVLEAGGISHRYGGKEVLADISFQVHPGEKVVLLGCNGSGKTTLLHLPAESFLEYQLDAQRAARETADNLKHTGFSEISASRGESAYVVDMGDVLLASIRYCLARADRRAADRTR